MSQELFTQILREHRELAALPQSLAEVLRVVRDDDSAPQDLAKVLSRDAALTAKVLRAANSSYYGSSRKVSTVSQAVLTLGMRAVTALALSTSIYNMTGHLKSAVDRRRFWRHALEVAVIGRMIAQSIGYPCPEEMFVSGLLHDVGMLVLESSFPDKYERIWRQVEAGEHLHDLEDDVWGTNHARVGQFLFEQWNLPSAICQAVGQHHTVFVTGADHEEFRHSQIVALANQVARFTVVESRPEHGVDAEQKEIILGNLRLNAQSLAVIEREAMPRTVDEAAFMEIDIGSEHEILVEANRMLYEHYLAMENLHRENQQMQEEIARDRMKKVALDALKTVTATFNHYINNAAATILGRAQLIEISLKQGDITDHKGTLPQALNVIINGINTICLVMEELTKLTSFETRAYHDDTYIVDIEDKIRAHLDNLEKPAKVSQSTG